MSSRKLRIGVIFAVICVIAAIGFAAPVIAISDNLNIGDLDVPSEANTGEEIEIESTAEIPSAPFADYTADLKFIATVDGTRAGTQEISIEDGESADILIEHEFQQSGEKEIKLKIKGELERDALAGTQTIDREIGPQTIDITPELTIEGAAFTAPESVQNEVDDVRDSIPGETGPHAFVLTSADEFYVIISDEKPQEGHVTVEGFTPPDADVVETDDFDFEVVIASDVEFDSPSPVSVSEVSQNPHEYDRKFVQISSHHRNIAIDYKEGPPVSTGVLVADPLETEELFGSVGSNARSALVEDLDDFDSDNIESALGEVTQDRVVTASFGTEEYWTNGEGTISGITAAPNTPARDFIESFRDEDILPTDTTTPVMYVVEQEYDAEEVSSISEISENAAEFDGELVTVESNFLQNRISTERVYQSTTGNSLPVDIILHGGAAWDELPDDRDDVMLMMAASSVEQDRLMETRTGMYQITGEVISTDRIEGDLPDGSILIIYDLERVDSLDTAANDIIENQASGVSDTLQNQTNPDDGDEHTDAPDFQLELVDGPTIIDQGAAYEATVEVSNDEDADAEDAVVDYELEDPVGISTDIAVSEETEEIEPGNSEKVTFEIGGDTTAYLTEINETYTHIFTAGDVEIKSEVTLVEELEDPFQLSDLEAPDQVEKDAEFDVSVLVENEGGEAGTQDIEYELEPDIGASPIRLTKEGVELEAGDSTTVEFEIEDGHEVDAGDYEHVVSSDDDDVMQDVTVVDNSTLRTIEGEIFFDDSLLVEPVTNSVTVEVSATDSDSENSETIAIDATTDTSPVGYTIADLEPGTYSLEAEIVTVDINPDRADEVAIEEESREVTVPVDGTSDGHEFTLNKLENDDKPSIDDYTDVDGNADVDDLREAIDDWRDSQIETHLLRAVIDAWRG